MKRQSNLKQEKPQHTFRRWVCTMCSSLVMASFVMGTSFIVTSCDNDDDFEIDESTLTVDHKVGTVGYDKAHKKWYIQVVPEGTVDSVETYYVDKMPKDYRQEGILVVFSGNCNRIMQGFEDYPAGHEFYSLSLSQIMQTAYCGFDDIKF